MKLCHLRHSLESRSPVLRHLCSGLSRNGLWEVRFGNQIYYRQNIWDTKPAGKLRYISQKFNFMVAALLPLHKVAAFDRFEGCRNIVVPYLFEQIYFYCAHNTRYGCIVRRAFERIQHDLTDVNYHVKE